MRFVLTLLILIIIDVSMSMDMKHHSGTKMKYEKSSCCRESVTIASGNAQRQLYTRIKED
jgi:hypothetical protein